MTDNEDIPIPGLADFESDVSSGFVGVVRKKIFRKTAVSQFANFSWKMPTAIFIELMNLIVHFVSAVGGRRTKQP
jgi:hypothetical protein